MNFFIQHIDRIRYIARDIAYKHKNYYEVDELVNEAYISYCVMVENSPNWRDGFKYSKGILLRRVKFDIASYIRSESKLRIKQNLEREDKKYPIFVSNSVSTLENEEGNNHNLFLEKELGEIDTSYEQIDNKNTLEYLNEKIKLSDKEWSIISEYFYEGKDTNEIGREMDYDARTISYHKNKALDKYKEVALSI